MEIALFPKFRPQFEDSVSLSKTVYLAIFSLSSKRQIEIPVHFANVGDLSAAVPIKSPKLAKSQLSVCFRLLFP